MKSTILFAILLGLILGGCKSPTDSMPQYQNLFSEGNYWIYHTTNYSSDGKVMSESTDSVYLLHVEDLKNNRFVQYNDSSWERKDDAGIWYTPSLGDTCGCSILRYKFPGSVGDTMFLARGVPIKIDGSFWAGVIVYSIINADISTTVAAGTFRCYEYQYDLLNDTVLRTRSIKYFSPLVGVTRVESYSSISSQENTLTSRQELIRYHIQ